MGFSASWYNGRYSAPHVRQLQKDLGAAGYSPGAVDGALGPKTRRAMQAAIADGLKWKRR